jgi:hypothetical protein
LITRLSVASLFTNSISAILSSPMREPARQPDSRVSRCLVGKAELLTEPTVACREHFILPIPKGGGTFERPRVVGRTIANLRASDCKLEAIGLQSWSHPEGCNYPEPLRGCPFQTPMVRQVHRVQTDFYIAVVLVFPVSSIERLPDYG